MNPDPMTSFFTHVAHVMARPIRVRGALACVLAAAVLVRAASAGPAIGQFEVKDLESTPGEFEFQSQNAHMFGQPDRKHRQLDGELAYDDNSVQRQRHALELEFGITPRLKSRIGIEFEKERIDDPDALSQADAFDDLELSEIGGEFIWILDPIDGDDWGFGLVAEYERPLDSEESSTLLLGSIMQTSRGPWWANVNLYLVKSLGGERPRDNKIDFAYASQFGYVFNDAWQLAIEAYGTVDRLGSSGTRGEAAKLFGDHDQHRAGPIVYFTGGLDGAARGDDTGFLIGAGVLIGLNDDTPDTTLKWTVEIEF